MYCRNSHKRSLTFWEKAFRYRENPESERKSSLTKGIHFKRKSVNIISSVYRPTFNTSYFYTAYKAHYFFYQSLIDIVPWNCTPFFKFNVSAYELAINMPISYKIIPTLYENIHVLLTQDLFTDSLRFSCIKFNDNFFRENSRFNPLDISSYATILLLANKAIYTGLILILSRTINTHISAVSAGNGNNNNNCPHDVALLSPRSFNINWWHKVSNLQCNFRSNKLFMHAYRDTQWIYFYTGFESSIQSWKKFPIFLRIDFKFSQFYLPLNPLESIKLLEPRVYIKIAVILAFATFI